MPENPFLDPAFHIRWSALTPDLVGPGIERALQRAQAAIDAIVARDFAALTFDNTFLALERATEELTVAWGKVTHLQSVADSPALRDAHNAMLPRVSAFYASIPLNAALWQRLKAFAEAPAAARVAGIGRRFLEETVKDFRQAGADLPQEKRERLQALQSELAQVTQKYSENVLDATNAWQLIVPEAEEHRLAGLPAHAKAAARKGAESKGAAGWRFTLHMPSQEPTMTYLEDAALRREIWTAASGVGAQAPHDNTALIARILTLRAEKAALLGQPHFADLVLERRMARSGARALEFVEDFQRLAATAFARECRELEEFKAQQLGLRSPGVEGTGTAPARLAPWEILFWSEKLRRERYNFDEEALRPFFPMSAVIDGMFELVRRVFGLRVAECGAGFMPAMASVKPALQNTVEVWHPEVKFYEVRDARHRPTFAKASEGRHVGSFYADWYPRESKRGGAWMNYLITGGPSSPVGYDAASPKMDGSRAPHLGLMCGNMTPPAAGKAAHSTDSTGSPQAGSGQALLNHREVETVFHEFGHLLHHLLGEVEIKSLNGVNVAWDFVELPSQIMENWTWERESLDLFARHHETGATIPEEIFQKMTAAKNFRSACATMRQVAFAKMDLLMHTRTGEFAAAADVEPLARAAIADCLTPTEPPGPTAVKRFTHIFADPVGYAAGYYSYKWAEVLDADAFTRFKREGIFSAKVGAEFVEKVLSRGNSADPEELYRSFMGREPDLNALLRRNGLAPAA